MSWDGIGSALLAGLVILIGLSFVFFWLRMLVVAAIDRSWGWFVIIFVLSLPGAAIYWMCEFRFKQSRAAREDREFLLDLREELESEIEPHSPAASAKYAKGRQSF
jgi:hypothetical protein